MRFASWHKSQSGLSIIQIGIGMILVQLGGILSLRYCRGYSPLGISNDRNASWQAVLNWCLDDRTEAGRNFSYCNWGNISLFANCNAWYLIQVLACKTKTWWIDDCFIYLGHTHHMWKIHCVSKQKNCDSRSSVWCFFYSTCSCVWIFIITTAGSKFTH